jgi:hypothetical protein
MGPGLGSMPRVNSVQAISLRFFAKQTVKFSSEFLPDATIDDEVD